MQKFWLLNSQMWCFIRIYAGPLIFLIPINDRCSICKHTAPILFADEELDKNKPEWNIEKQSSETRRLTQESTNMGLEP